MQRGLLDPEKVDPFSLFVESGGLTYCLYKDSERVLGNTFGMCILQVTCKLSLTKYSSLADHSYQKIVPCFFKTKFALTLHQGF